MQEPNFTELTVVMRSAIEAVEAATSLDDVKAALLPVLRNLEARYVGRARDYGEKS